MCDYWQQFIDQYSLEYEDLPSWRLSNDDLDLSRVSDEDVVLCRLMLWLVQLEEKAATETGNEKGFDCCTALQSHRENAVIKNAAIRTTRLHTWKLENGRHAVSRTEAGPFAILNHDVLFGMPTGGQGMHYIIRFGY